MIFPFILDVSHAYNFPHIKHKSLAVCVGSGDRKFQVLPNPKFFRNITGMDFWEEECWPRALIFLGRTIFFNIIPFRELRRVVSTSVHTFYRNDADFQWTSNRSYTRLRCNSPLNIRYPFQLPGQIRLDKRVNHI